MPAIYDALIIGAGPAGSTTAFLLAEAGWSVAIVEKKAFPRVKVCGEFISATSLPLLQKLNLKEYYYAYGGPEIQRVGLFIKDTIIVAPMPKMDSSSHWGRALERKYLDNALLDKACHSGAKRWQPWEVKNVEQKGNLYTTTLLSNHRIKTIESRTIIMANGSWEKNLPISHIPDHNPSDLLAFKRHFNNSNLSSKHAPSDLLAFKRHFINSDLPSDLMPLLAFPGGYGGLVRSSKDRVTLSCCIRRDTLQYLRKQYSGLLAGEAVFKHINETCLGARQALASVLAASPWLAAGPIRPGIRQCYKDKIFYVGNAAGEAHPIIAEGISMAIQSAELLSKQLIRYQDKIHINSFMNKIGHDYTKQWNNYFSNRIHIAAILAQLAMRPKIATMLLPFLKKFPHILTLGASLSGKTKSIA
ncbi:MAG: NAD(P)/FAD-dependent oxidoreductase, partial [Gammaproteobacteria bacterium]|nr:NAD(P)/FAD-dependent oxidoreductase [Gammaproteobacteria bacterium]